MNRALIVMAIITLALSVYALSTAQLPPASIDYKEVFYIDNQSVTFVTKDGYGLFSMKIHPRVSNFKLTIKFPEGTSYIVRYGEKTYRGTEEVRIDVSKENLPDEIYIQFQLSKEITRKLVYENGEARITIKGDKIPVWHAEDTIFVKYRKEEKKS